MDEGLRPERVRSGTEVAFDDVPSQNGGVHAPGLCSSCHVAREKVAKRPKQGT